MLVGGGGGGWGGVDSARVGIFKNSGGGVFGEARRSGRWKVCGRRRLREAFGRLRGLVGALIWSRVRRLRLRSKVSWGLNVKSWSEGRGIDTTEGRWVRAFGTHGTGTVTIVIAVIGGTAMADGVISADDVSATFVDVTVVWRYATSTCVVVGDNTADALAVVDDTVIVVSSDVNRTCARTSTHGYVVVSADHIGVDVAVVVGSGSDDEVSNAVPCAKCVGAVPGAHHRLCSHSSVHVGASHGVDVIGPVFGVAYLQFSPWPWGNQG